MAAQTRLGAVPPGDGLDALPHRLFDRICSIAADVFGTPAAVVSIVEQDRIRFLGRHGLELEDVGRSVGLFVSAVMPDEVTVFTDVTLDPILATNRFVAGEIGVRFCAAAPIRTGDEHKFGALCVLDTEPRTVTETQTSLLENLAALISEQVEAHLSSLMAVSSEDELSRIDPDDGHRNERFADALRATLLPARLPAIPGLDLAALYRPADRSLVGGDFYDVFPLGQGAWGVTIGDVCGKGADAAVIAASARYAVRAAAVEHRNPSQVLSVVNGALLIDVAARGNEIGFCTVAYARLQPYRDGYRLTAASGGHPLPMIRRGSGRVEDFGSPGTLLGVLAEAPCTDHSTFLRTGDTVLLFTDGLSEVPTQTGYLSRSDVQAAFSRHQTSALDVVEYLDTTLSSQAVGLRDDTALVVLRVNYRPRG